jgi:hypothetical protein
VDLGFERDFGVFAMRRKAPIWPAAGRSEGRGFSRPSRPESFSFPGGAAEAEWSPASIMRGGAQRASRSAGTHTMSRGSSLLMRTGEFGGHTEDSRLLS